MMKKVSHSRGDFYMQFSAAVVDFFINAVDFTRAAAHSDII